MKISVALIDDRGSRYEGSVELAPIRSDRMPVARLVKHMTSGRAAAGLSFNLNPRAFVKRYGRGLKGPAKFTLLVARLAKGEERSQVTLEQIRSHWNNMKTLMGGRFNPAHTTRARDHGWVDTPKRGVYVLSSSWKEALEDDND